MDLRQLIKDAEDKVKSMSHSDQLRMWYEQRRSFAKGMCSDSADYTKHCEMVDAQFPPTSKLSDAEIGLVLIGQYHV